MTIKKISIYLLVILFIFSIYCAYTIGMSWDEMYHHINGGVRSEYLKTLGKFKGYNFLDNQYYPGLYDTLSFSALSIFLKIFPTYILEIKHLINLFFGFLTLLGLFLLVKKFFNESVAYLSTLICFINPFFFGHMSINPKDTIISFSLIWFLYAAWMYCNNFYNKRFVYLLLMSFFMGFGLGTRASFFIIVLPTGIAAIIFLVQNNKNDSRYLIYKKIFIDFIIFFTVSFILMVSAWPHVLDTFFNGGFYLIRDTVFGSLKWLMGPTLEIINGNIYETTNTPRTYILSFLLFREPIYWLILLFILPILLIIDKKFFIYQFTNFEKKILVIISIIIFPILLAILLKVKLYNGIRLFLFITPFLSLLSGICLYYILKNIKKNFYIKTLLFSIIIFFILFLQRFSYLTPYHYDYSNFLNFNFAKTEKLYVHDYWATSYKELMQLIKKNPEIKKIKTDFCGGDLQMIKFLSNKYSGKKILYAPYEEADYIIMINTLSTDVENKSSCYNIHPGENIVEVKRLGVNLSVLRKLKK